MLIGLQNKSVWKYALNIQNMKFNYVDKKKSEPPLLSLNVRLMLNMIPYVLFVSIYVCLGLLVKNINFIF